MSETAGPTEGAVHTHKPDIDSLVAALASPDQVTRESAARHLLR